MKIDLRGIAADRTPPIVDKGFFVDERINMGTMMNRKVRVLTIADHRPPAALCTAVQECDATKFRQGAAAGSTSILAVCWK